MRSKKTAIIKQYFILGVLFTFANWAAAQTNAFLPGNVVEITATPNPDGNINKLNNGNTSIGDYIDFYTNDPVEITFELITAKAINQYNVFFFSANYAADSCSFFGSTDGSVWDSLDQQSANTSLLKSVINNTKAYKYYKFRFIGIHNSDLSPTEIEASEGEVNTPVLTGGSTLGSKVVLNWTQVFQPVNQATGTFELQRSSDGANFSLIQTLPGASTNYTDTGLQRSTKYWYMIRAVLPPKASLFSSQIEVLTANDSLNTAPTMIAPANDFLSNSVALKWAFTEIDGMGGFELEKSTDGTNFFLFKKFDKVKKSFDDTTLYHNTSYWYRIRAFNTINMSPYSLVATVKTINDSLLAPPVLAASTSSAANTSLSWTVSPFSTNAAATKNIKGEYQIERSTDGNNFSVLGLTGRVDKSVTKYNDESLTPNTTYWYRIKAINYLNESGYSAIVTITTNSITSVPTDITDDGGQLFVSAENKVDDVAGPDNLQGSSHFIDNDLATKWLVFDGETDAILSAVYKPTAQYLITGYALGTAEDAPERDPRDWTFSGSEDSLTWVDLDARVNQLGSSVPRNTLFDFPLVTVSNHPFVYYRIQYNANNSSTDGVRYQTSEWQIYGVPQPAPGIPENLIVTSKTNSSISIKWEAVPAKPATKYILQRSVDALYFTVVDTVPATTLTYTNSGLIDSTTYFYRVQAIGATNLHLSGWSNVAKATTAFAEGIPISPINLSASFFKDTIAVLTWKDRSYNETGFELEQSVDGVTFTVLKTIDMNVITYSDTKLWPANYYYYRIRAVNSKGKSPYSNIIKLLTDGQNTGPFVIDPIVNQKICLGKGDHRFSFTGAVGAVSFESNQIVRVTSVKANTTDTDATSAKFITNFSFNPVVSNGLVSYSFSTTDMAKAGDSAIVIVTIKDNGGTNSFGVDSSEIPIKFYFEPLTVNIKSNKDSIVPRYVLVTLTAHTNFPATATYRWQNTDGIEGAIDKILLWVRPTRTSTYTVTASTAGGCLATKSITISPIADEIVVANVITPNGDGKNDKLIIWGIDKLPNNTLKIFDRAGRLLLTRKNYSNDWEGKLNGKLLDEGVYHYLFDPGNADKQLSGTINIVY